MAIARRYGNYLEFSISSYMEGEGPYDISMNDQPNILLAKKIQYKRALFIFGFGK